LLVFSLFLVLAYPRSVWVQQLNKTAGYMVLPVQYIVDFPLRIVGLLLDEFTSRQMLQHENAMLKAKLVLLEGRLQKVYAIENENQQLRALLQSADRVEDRVSVAQLLAVNLSPFAQTILINQGSNDQAFVGQPVLDPYGVMGQVISVNASTSQVMLLTDSRSAVPVQVSRNGLRAIAVGVPEKNSLQLKYVTDTMDIREGDLLVTSGLGQRYPFGYPVGTVTSVQSNTGEHFKIVDVEPAAHLDRSRLLLLVWHEQGAA
jgi:rod shape-determining protein MreC